MVFNVTFLDGRNRVNKCHDKVDFLTVGTCVPVCVSIVFGFDV